MSAPPPETVKVPDVADAWPLSAGLPTSCVCQGAGSVPVAVVTVKGAALLATLFTVTTRLPVVAPLGTGATMLDDVQLVGVAVVPLNLTVLVPGAVPKFVPLIVTDVPTGPLPGETFVIDVPALVTFIFFALLATPPTLTTTPPVVAPAG